MRDGRQPIECPDCGAYLMWWTKDGEHFLRCPWAESPRWYIDSTRPTRRIYCRWPLGEKRVVGGISPEPAARP